MPRRSRLKTFRDAALYRALLAITFFARLIPLPIGRFLGARIGDLARMVLRRDRERSLAHLALAFPEKSHAERVAIMRAMFRHLGVTLFEVTWLSKADEKTIMSLTEWDGLEHLKEAAASGRGILYFTGHLGNWEWMAAAVRYAGVPVTVIAREVRDSRFNDYTVALRTRFGIRTIERGSASAAKKLLQALRSPGEILGALIDQNLKAESVDVPFFGMPARTPAGPAQLAIRTGAVAIAGFDERRGKKHIVHLSPVRVTNRDDDARELTAEMTKLIEDQIRRVPEQWVWMHERWKDR